MRDTLRAIVALLVLSAVVVAVYFQGYSDGERDFEQAPPPSISKQLDLQYERAYTAGLEDGCSMTEWGWE